MRLRTTIITNEPTLIALVLVGLGGGVAPSMRSPADLHGKGWGENYSASAGAPAVRGNVRHEHRTAPLWARSSGQPGPRRLGSASGLPPWATYRPWSEAEASVAPRAERLVKATATVVGDMTDFAPIAPRARLSTEPTAVSSWQRLSIVLKGTLRPAVRLETRSRGLRGVQGPPHGGGPRLAIRP